MSLGLAEYRFVAGIEGSRTGRPEVVGAVRVGWAGLADFLVDCLIWVDWNSSRVRPVAGWLHSEMIDLA